MRSTSTLPEDDIRVGPAAGAWPQGGRLAAALILAVVGFLALLLATPWGIGASPDSVVYILGARSLAHGSGFSQVAPGGQPQAITHHAPLYAVLLAGPARLGVDPLHGARWINAALLAGLALMMAAIAMRLLPGRGWRAAALGAALALAAPALVEVYLMAWSEALFLPLALGALWLLSEALEGGSRRRLAAAAGLAALACLARYAGLALALSGGLAILLLSRQTLTRRLLDAVLFGAIAVAPLALWMARNQLAGGSATSREVGVHWIGLGHIQQAVTTLGGWFFVPAGWPAALKLLPWGLAAALFAWQLARLRLRRPEAAGAPPAAPSAGFPVFVWAGLIFGMVYFAFLAASISFLDANTPLDSRILSPLLPVFLLVMLVLVDRWLGVGQAVLPDRRNLGLDSPTYGRGGRAAAAVIGGLYLLAGLATAVGLVRSSFANGLGFSGRMWRQSPLVAAAAQLPAGTWAYSNATEPVELHTPLPALALPKKFESANRQANPEYAAQMEQVRLSAAAGPAVIVYFNGVQRPSLAGLDELQAEFPTAQVQSFADGVLLWLPAP